MKRLGLQIFICVSVISLFTTCTKKVNEEVQVKSIDVTGSLQFSQVTVSTTSKKLLLIENIGKAVLTVTDVDCPQGFSADWTHGKISAGETQTVEITFAPTVAKSYSGDIKVVSDATVGNNETSVKGEGMIAAAPILTIDRTSIPFGDVDVATTASNNFIIKNTGNAPLIITNITTSDQAIFNGYYSGSNTSVPAGGSDTVTVTFTPASEQSYNGTYTVNTNVGTRTVSVTGKGVYVYDIYVAGYEYGTSGGGQLPTYWKNLIPTRLSVDIISKRGIAHSIALVGETVYTAGEQINNSGDDEPIYWKDENGTRLINGNTYNSGKSYGIAVDGSDIYVAGYQIVDVSNATAKYWKIGASSVGLTKESDGSGVANGITIYNGIPYTCGRLGNYAKYWVGGYEGYTYNITNGSYAAQATAITVSNSIVYTAGYEKNATGKMVAKVWKNNTVLNTLSDGTRDAIANSIFVVGSDVYVAGTGINSTGTVTVAKYWKNGTAVTLGRGLQNSRAFGITVVNGDVFVAGDEVRSDGIRMDAVYWKNGTKVIIPANNSASGRAIAVKKR